jgi:hypothetical protein
MTYQILHFSERKCTKMVELTIIVFLLQNLFRGSEAGVNLIKIKDGVNIANKLDHF